jgi:hypothetical protein
MNSLREAWCGLRILGARYNQAVQSLECLKQHKMLISVCVLLAAGFLATCAQDGYIVPDAKFEALKPRGLRISIPGMRNVHFNLFLLQLLT